MKPSRVAMVLALALVLAGCAGRYGSIRFDNEVERVFSEARVLPGHRPARLGRPRR